MARAAFSAAVGFLAGVAVASLRTFGVPELASMLALAAALAAASVPLRRAAPALACVFLCTAVLGALRFESARLEPDQALNARIGERVTIAGAIIEEPDARDASTRLTVAADSLAGSALDIPTGVLVVAPAHDPSRYGDRIEANCKLKQPQSFESGEGRSFDYPMYLASRGISYECAYAEVEVESSGGNVFVRAALAAKRAYINGLRAVLPEPYAGLASGITAGDKRSVGDDLSDTFRRVSLVHILVLSGYNITVVLGVFLARIGRMHRAAQLAVVLFVVSFFIVISGGASSAIRASGMALGAAYARLYGRLFLAIRALLAVVVAMVVWNPYVLAFDPGFQLSVLSTLGLVLFAPHVARGLAFIPDRGGLREIAAATIATQLAVLPLLLYQNGTLSIVGIPANMLALIAVPAAMFFSAVAALAGVLFGTWGAVAAFPAYLLLRYVVAVAELFSAAPFSSVQIPAFSAAVLAAAYAALLAAYAYLVLKTKTAPVRAEAVSK